MDDLNASTWRDNWFYENLKQILFFGGGGEMGSMHYWRYVRTFPLEMIVSLSLVTLTVRLLDVLISGCGILNCQLPIISVW